MILPSSGAPAAIASPPPPLLHPSYFFFNDTATTEIYTLSLHDALPICLPATSPGSATGQSHPGTRHPPGRRDPARHPGHHRNTASAGFARPPALAGGYRESAVDNGR